MYEALLRFGSAILNHKDAERIAGAYGNPSLAAVLIWLDDHEFYAKVKVGRQHHLFRHVRALPPFPKQGDESQCRDVLKTSRMRFGQEPEGC